MRKYAKIALLLTFGLLIAFSAYPGDQDGFTKSPTGLTYKIFKVGKETVKPSIGDWITIDMRYAAKMNGKDTLLFDSRTQMQGAPVKMELPESDFRGDLYEGIRMLSPGDSGIFIINSDSLFTRTFRMPQRPETIDSNAAVTFFVHLIAAESPAQLKIREEEALKKYLADNKISATPSATGIYIVKMQEGEGVKIDSGYTVKLQFVVSLIDGKPIFSSYDRPEPLSFEYGKRFDTEGLQEAIGTMKKGERVRVVVPYPMAFGEKGRGSIVPAYATLLYEVEILDVISKEELEKQVEQEKKLREEQRVAAIQGEQAAIVKYVTDNKITVAPMSSGLYYIEKAAGTGPQAGPGKMVKVHYTGTLLDGTKFDSSVDRGEPLSFELGRGLVIAGWEEGLALMKQGGKALLIIPSKIAYGEVDKGLIPPYSTLLFEVELVEVK